MASGVGTIEVKKMKGKMVVSGLGRTARGQKFIKKAISLEATSTTDPKFKAEQATAVAEILG